MPAAAPADTVFVCVTTQGALRDPGLRWRTPLGFGGLRQPRHHARGPDDRRRAQPRILYLVCWRLPPGLIESAIRSIKAMYVSRLDLRHEEA